MTPRLLADDLTGALDAAAQFGGLVGSVSVYLGFDGPVAGAAAFDSRSRDIPEREAYGRSASLAPLLVAGDPAFCKVDSLLRGNPAAAVAACMERGGFAHCVIAPAYPAQRRATRAGRQFVRGLRAEGWLPTGVDLAADLRRLGCVPSLRRPGENAPAGVSFWDSETESDLSAVVTAARALSGPVLWCGSAGLAAALAGSPPLCVRRPVAPLLACVGTDHPVTLSQLEAVSLWHVRARAEALDRDGAEVSERLAQDGFAAVSFTMKSHLPRVAAAAHIQECFARLLGEMGPPASLFVTGGETLRGICTALKAEALEVEGEICPGVPSSRIRGGLWNGVRVISKSGAFGDDRLLAGLATPLLHQKGC